MEQSAVNYQKELAAEVEEAQKALIQDRQFHKKDELGSNLIQRHKLHCVHSLTIYTTVALGRRGIKQVHGSFLRDEVKNTSETTQSQINEHTHASTLTSNRATFSDQCFCHAALALWLTLTAE